MTGRVCIAFVLADCNGCFIFYHQHVIIIIILVHEKPSVKVISVSEQDPLTAEMEILPPQLGNRDVS